jgi:hypothetical protein
MVGWWQRSVATVILSSNGPDGVTYARCYCGSLIKNHCAAFVNPNPRRLSLTSSDYQNFPPKISLELAPSSTSPEPVPSLSPPQSLHTIVESSLESPHHRSRPRSRPLHAAIFLDLSWWSRRPRRPHPQARDAVPEPATMSSSPSPWCCAPRSIPEPMMLTTHAVPRSTTPSSSLSPQRLEHAMTSNPHWPWAHSTVILPKPARLHCIFLFVILGLQILILTCDIALICYIAFILLHCFDVLHCHIFWIYYIAFNMSHCFDMIHCFSYAALLWYATLPHCFDMLHCDISLIWYIAFVLLHCFEVLHSQIALIWCYIAFNMSHWFDMLHCFW